MSNTLFESINIGAEFSEDKKHRIALWRIWDETKPKAMFIGLNPSKADRQDDDPTIKSVKRISAHNGYGGFYMLNLYTFITPYPEELTDMTKTHPDILSKYYGSCKDVVFAWGVFKKAKEASAKVIWQFPNALCIGKTKDGHPLHPLFQKGTSILSSFK